MSIMNAVLVSGFTSLKMTASIQEALLQVAQDVFTPKIVKDAAKEVRAVLFWQQLHTMFKAKCLLRQIMCLQTARAATLEKHYSSQHNMLTAALADMHNSLGQVKQGAAATADHFKDFQVGSDINNPMQSPYMESYSWPLSISVSMSDSQQVFTPAHCREQNQHWTAQSQTLKVLTSFCHRWK